MFVYYIAYFGMLASRFVSTRISGRGVLYYFFLFLLFIFVAFRFRVGCDWDGYYMNWIWAKNLTLAQALENTEPAHWTIIVLFQQWGIPYPFINVVAASIFFLGLNSLARRQPDPLAFLALSFPILIINMAMSGIRQSEAIGLMCFAYGAFIDRRIIKFTIFVLLAYLFHQSAIVFLFFLPLIRGKQTRINVLGAILLALPGLYFLMNSDTAQEAVSRYVDTGVDAAGAAFRLGLLVLTGIGYHLFLDKKWEALYPRDYKLVTISAWLMTGSIFVLIFSSTIGDRFGYYLIPLQLMIFSRIPYLGLKKNRDFLIAAPYVMLTVIFLVWTQQSSHFQRCYLPYRLYGPTLF